MPFKAVVTALALVSVIAQGAGTDEGCLIEILASRTNAEIRHINENYKLRMQLTLQFHTGSQTSCVCAGLCGEAGEGAVSIKD